LRILSTSPVSDDRIVDLKEKEERIPIHSKHKSCVFDDHCSFVTKYLTQEKIPFTF